MDSDSIFLKATQPSGMFENTGAGPQAGGETAPQGAPAASGNPFGTGTDTAEPPSAVAPQPAAGADDRDADIRVTVDGKGLAASVSIDPPSGAGQPPTREALMAAIEKAGIVYGLLEEGLARALAPTYHEHIIIAEATTAENGRDGQCIELYERVPIPKPTEREDGTIQHRQLGLIREMKPGTTICEMVLPTEGKTGTNVLGVEMKPLPGKKAVPLVGEGTRLSEDGTRVEAVLNGNLAFRSGKYCVDTVYRVQDINYDVGNIVFSGDVQVNGDMQDGFEIRAGGSVQLRGSVGGVTIVAGGDISIDKGINGTGQAHLETAGTLTSGFIENCSIRAGVKVVASSLINSTVECEGDVEVTNGRGIICGGKITALGSVKAKVVGNESNTPTLIALGVTPRLLADRKKVSDQVQDVTHHIEEMVKNTTYIEQALAANKPVPPDRVQMLQRTKIQMPMSEKKLEQLKKTLDEMDERLSNVSGSSLSAKTVYPPTRVSIGKYSLGVSDTQQNCRIYMADHEIVVGKSY